MNSRWLSRTVFGCLLLSLIAMTAALVGGQDPPRTLIVTPAVDSLTLTVGDTARIPLAVRTTAGRALAAPAFTYSGSNATAFGVGHTGLITARAPGCGDWRATFAAFARTQVVVCVVARPSTPTPSPIPTPAPSAWPNEPAGFRVVASWENEATLLPPGWRCDSRQTGPECPNPHTGGNQRRAMLDGVAVIEGVTAAGSAGGFGMGRVVAAIGDRDTVYAAVRHQFAADYPGSDNSNKLLFLDWGTTQVMIGWRANVPQLPAENNRWGVTLEDGFTPAAKLTTDGPVALGRWQLIELYLQKHTAGQRNGIVRLWVDGRLVLDRRDVLFPAGSARQFYNEGTNNGVRVNGGARTVPRAARRWTRAMRISAPGR
jgi:hypothetical protein